MKSLLLLITLCLSVFSFAQISGNIRSSYEAVSALLPEQKKKMASQSIVYKGVPIETPTQEELIKLNHVKSEIKYYEGSTSIYHYDTSGVLSKVESKDGEDISFEVFAYEFDGAGNVLKETNSDLEDGGYMKCYQYDEKNRVIAKSYSRNGGDTSFTNMYYNDNLGVMIEVSEYGYDKYYYNELGLRVFFQSYDENLALVGSSESNYSSVGLKIDEESHVMGMTLNDTYSYNERGQLLHASRTSMMVDATWSHEYNDLGLETKFLNVSSSFETETITEYTYYE